MSREKEDYRTNLERLREIFVGRDVISCTQAAKYLGVDARTLKSDKKFPVKSVNKKYIVPLTGLASWLS